MVLMASTPPHAGQHAPLPVDEPSGAANAADASGHLLGAADIRRIAAEAGISPTKKYGQNFVIDPGTVRRIVREAGVQPGDHVLEIGPGLGSLTLALLEAGAVVDAVEIDPELAARLPRTVAQFMPQAQGSFAVLQRDALTLQPSDLPTLASCERFTLVANLPYNVATPIVLTLLERFDNLDRFLVMVQKEVADRLAATPGGKVYGTPSVKLAWYGTAERVGLVGRNVFWPAPNVDSALVAFSRSSGRHPDDDAADNNDSTASADGINNTADSNTHTIHTAHAEELHAPGERERVFRLIDAAFGQRRKTLHAALRRLVPDEAYARAGIDPTRRGETLTIEEFTTLSRAMGSCEASASDGTVNPDMVHATVHATTVHSDTGLEQRGSGI
jgi:16S rRNA (adenine1518-N6/adenine1519-N6)-dimethyltransferase